MTTKAELAAAVVAAAQEVGSYPLGCIAKRVGSDGPDGLGWPVTAHRVRDLNDALVRYENAPDDAPPDAAATKRVTVCEQADGFASLDTGEGQDMYGGVEPALRAAARHFGVSLDGPATNELAPAPHEWKAGDLARIKPCSIWHQKEFVGRVIRLADTPDNNAPTGAHFHFTDGDDTGRKYYILTRELEPLPADVCQACGGALGDDAWQGECWDCVVKWADEQAKKVIAAVERERAAGHTVEVHMCEEPAPINCYDGRRLSLDAFAPCHVAGRWARFKQVHHVGNVGIQCDFGPCCGYHAGNVDAVRRVIAAVPAQPERREEVEL